MSSTVIRRAWAVALAVAISASTFGLAASPASASVGSCTFSGGYGAMSTHPYATGYRQQATLYGVIGSIYVTGCSAGGMTVTGVPIAAPNTAAPAVGTPVTCTDHVVHTGGHIVGAGCSSLPMGVLVNTINILLTAEVVLVAANGDYAVKTASCIGTFDHWNDPVGIAGPRCSISG